MFFRGHFPENGWILGGGDRAPARGPRFGLIVLPENRCDEDFFSQVLLPIGHFFPKVWPGFPKGWPGHILQEVNFEILPFQPQGTVFSFKV
jgi:hypothetical protein